MASRTAAVERTANTWHGTRTGTAPLGRLVHDVWFRGRRVGRFVGIDVARCAALVGMVDAHTRAHVVHGSVPWDQRIAIGNSAALFALLAGVTLALLSGRESVPTGRFRRQVSVAFLVRAALIMVIGLALNRLHDGGIGVILPYYALLFVLGLPFLALRPRVLLAMAAGWAVVVPVVSQLARPGMPAYGTAGFSHLSPFHLLLGLGLTGDYPALPWMVYLLTGLAIGRMKLNATTTAYRLIVGGAALTVLAQAVSWAATSSPAVRSRLLATWPGASVDSWHALSAQLGSGLEGTTPTGSFWWLAVAAPHSGSPADLASTTGLAALMIGLCLVLARRATGLWAVIGGAGRMTLSLYSLHLIMLLPSTWPDVGRPQFLPEVAVVMGLGAAFVLLGWRGPLEGPVSALSQRVAGLPWRPGGGVARRQ